MPFSLWTGRPRVLAPPRWKQYQGTQTRRQRTAVSYTPCKASGLSVVDVRLSESALWLLPDLPSDALDSAHSHC